MEKIKEIIPIVERLVDEEPEELKPQLKQVIKEIAEKAYLFWEYAKKKEEIEIYVRQALNIIKTDIEKQAMHERYISLMKKLGNDHLSLSEFTTPTGISNFNSYRAFCYLEKVGIVQGILEGTIPVDSEGIISGVILFDAGNKTYKLRRIKKECWLTFWKISGTYAPTSYSRYSYAKKSVIDIINLTMDFLNTKK